MTDHSLTSIYSGNYWSGLIYPDEDYDGVVDVPYYIPAPIEKKDEHPRVYAYPDYKIHILTKPIPIFPKTSLDTDYYFSMMNVTWAPAGDTFLHSIYYSLFYSTNETSEWVPVGLNISGTEYELNTTEFPHNLTCHLNIMARCSDRIHVSSPYEQNFTVREHILSSKRLYIQMVKKSLVNTWKFTGLDLPVPGERSLLMISTTQVIVAIHG